MSSPHTIIHASAGAGKTYQLSTRYLRLLFRGVEAENILASTFTRKAAGEILQRVFERLAKGSLSEDEAHSLTGALGLDDAGLPETRACLARLVRAMDRIQVSTIDAFFAQLATAFALELGLPPHWRMLDESAVQALRLDAIQRLAEDDRAELLELWRLHNEGADQRSLSAQLDGLAAKAHGLYVEGDERAWRFLESEIDGPPPRRAEIESLALRFDQLPDPPTGHWRKPLAKDRGLLLAERFEDLLGGGIAKALGEGKDEYYRKPIAGAYLELYEDIVAVGTRAILHRFAARNRAVHGLLAHFDAHFQRLKLERGSLYFDDLPRLLGNLDLMGELDEIFYRLETQIHHVLLDEFQDTSREQWRVLAPIVEEMASQTEGDNSVFVVGDSKQAIYGWRGGEAEIFRRLHTDLHLGEESLKQLSESWRSAQGVLDGVNALFGRLSENPVLAGYPDCVAKWSRDFQEHETARPELAGQVVYHAAAESAPDSSEGRATSVRERTVELIANLRERHPHADIGVLLRRNEALASLRADLAARGIDSSEEGGVSLARQPAVTLLLSLLRLAEHPGDRIALFHLATSPLRESLELGLPPRGSDGPRLSSRIRRQIEREGLRAGLLPHALELMEHCGAASRARLRQLLSAAEIYDRDPNSKPSDFVPWIENGRAAAPTQAPVRLMTVHAAKGLQFSIVVLCDLESSFARRRRDEFMVSRDDPRAEPRRITRSPKKLHAQLSPTLARIESADTERKMSELLSVLYVGMTRASQALHLVAAAPQEKRPDDSPGALLRAAIFAGEEPAAGESRLVAGQEELRIETSKEEAQEPRESRRPRLAPGRSSRHAPSAAPSSHESGERHAAGALLRPIDPTARLRGLALHRCFQGVSFSEDPVEDDASILRGLRRELPGRGEGELGRHLAEFHELRQRDVIRRALSRASYAERWGDGLRLELWRERAYALRDGGGIVRGRYDRVVLGCDDAGIARAHVLDFKSDRVDPDDEDELRRLRENYSSQMAAYPRAVARRCRLPEESIECSLLLLSASLHLSV